MRALLSRGWAELSVDDAHSCLAIDDVNQQSAFPRVAAVVHHGGAGTTAAAARAGVPQVVCPMFGDQFYWASRVCALGVGTSLVGQLSAGALAAALNVALDAGVHARCEQVARQLGANGAMVAARQLVGA